MACEKVDTARTSKGENDTMKLYEYPKELESILEQCMDPESGEIIEDDLWNAYEALQMERDQKAEGIGCWIKDLEAEAKAIREEERALAARRRSAENQAERLRRYLQFSLRGEKFSTPRLSVWYKKSQKVEVDENRLNEIPERFLRYKQPEVAKEDVRKALVAGETVPGCALVDNVSMIIK